LNFQCNEVPSKNLSVSCKYNEVSRRCNYGSCHRSFACTLFLEVVECGKPQNVTNGNVYCSSTTFNSTATYVCDPKFRLVGAHRIYCNESGRWHPAAPLCYGISNFLFLALFYDDTYIRTIFILF
uniref:Sushi domain-containing protein n=1 Tax=Parascaris equorum TaxID=6256 RepID=A0A914R5B4_PAREQ